jgi:hypothetical protein
MNRRLGLVVGVALIIAAAWLILARSQGNLLTDGFAPSGVPTPGGSYPPLMAVEDLYAAFETSGRATSAGEPTVLSSVPAGDLVLPSGRVVAADVFFFTTEPFTRRLPVGRHPVILLSSARDPDLVGDVAAAMIRVAPGDPVRWEMAVVPGQDPTTLEPGEFFGYPVDSGTGAFASAEAVDLLMREGAGEDYGDEISDGLFPSEGVYNQSIDVTVDPASGANVIGFVSGFGDGAYPSWFGLGADGEPLVLLTDFGILDAPFP